MKKSSSTSKGMFISGGLFLIMIALLVVLLIQGNMGAKCDTENKQPNETTEQVVENKTPESKPVEQTESNSSMKNYITVENAIDAALTNAGIDRQATRDIDVELEHKFGQVVYEVNFDSGQYEYEYYINAENGEIVKSFQEVNFN